ncbi:MAG: ABC transporter ATP-binding protein [Acidimicrobiales bacterium]
MTAAPVLAVSGLEKSFGGFRAVAGVDFELAEGQVLGMVGPNGSGKTTVINVVSGVYPPDRGQVLLGGAAVQGLASHRLAHAGLNRTFQVPRPLGGLTVAENLQVAAGHAGRGRGQPGRGWGQPDAAGGLLELVGLAGTEARPAASLNASQQKRLDLARALATGPRALLVDELGAGLSPAELDEAAELLVSLAAGGMALLVVEHLMGFLAKVTRTVMVLNAGQEIFTGPIDEAVADEQVVKVFLGG